VSATVPQEACEPAASVRRAAASRGVRLAGYDLLLCSLLGFMAAARLWLVPGYLRADTWLALTTGRDVWTSGIPHRETLTALAAGDRWVDQQWLGQLMTYGIFRAGGLALVAALSVLLAAGSFAAMTIAARRLGARARTVLLLMPATAFPFFAQSWQPRTQMFAYPLFTAVFLLLVWDARRHRARVLWVLPLLALWANLHGSAILGAALIAMRGCTLAWEQRSVMRRPRAWAIPLALTALPWLLLAATPYGLGTGDYYRDTVLDGKFKQLATEWQPVTHDPLLLVAFVALAILVCWTLLRARRETTLWERLALVLLAVAAATAVRNMVWFTLGALPVLASALNPVVPADPAQSRFGMRVNTGLAIAAAAAATIALAVTLTRPHATFERDYPSGYLAAVSRAAALDPGARIVADVGDADWLLWRSPSLRGRVAFDARLELISASGVSDIASLLRGPGGHSSLTRGDYRIFALDRRAAAATARRLSAAPGHRVLFSDARRVVIVTQPASAG
jgi:hypothetical protein